LSLRKAFSNLFIFVAVFFISGCYPVGQEFQLTDDAGLINIVIAGVSAVLGTPSAELGEETAGSVNIFDGSDGPTEGTPINSGYSLTKIVQFKPNDEFIYADNFESIPAYANELIENGDFFVFLVTAKNGLEWYYRVNVRKGEADFLYHLDESNIVDAADVDVASNFQNVRFFINSSNIPLPIPNFDTATSYDEVVETFGNPISTILAVNENLYLYAFEFTGEGSGTLVKTYTTGVQLSGGTSDETITITLDDATPAPTPPMFDPEDPKPEYPIPEEDLGDYVESITGDTASDPVTIKLDAITFATSSSPADGVVGWAELNRLIRNAEKYVILDLSDCTADGNAIFGDDSSPSGNDMNIIKSNSYLKGIILPNNLVTIHDSAFADCTNLTSIVIQGNVELIETRAFDGCSDLVSVEFKSASTTIEDNAFPEGSSGDGGNTLKTAYIAGQAGVYKRDAGGSNWEKI
jgi:hypothetical protein